MTMRTTTLRPFKGALVLLWLFSYFSLYIFGIRNGLLGQIVETLKEGVLTDGTRFGGRFTGLRAVDLVGGGLVRFFWPILDGNNPYLSVANVPFAGQFVATYLLAYIEEGRLGNKGRGILSATALGLIIQMHGFATVIPMYLFMHLAKSGTTFAPTTSSLLPADYEALFAAPFIVLFSYVLLTVLISLPAPSVISVETKVYSIALWLFFAGLGYLFGVVIKKVLGRQPRNTELGKSRSRDMSLLRRVYALGLVAAVAGNLYTISISWSAYLFPGIFNARLVQSLTPANVYIMTSPFRRNFEVDGIDQGVHIFMQWDLFISGLAYMLWALVLRYSVHARDENNLYGALAKLSWWDLTELLLRYVILGPVGSALSLVWERDEVVYAGGHGKAA
ncbi:hypothetical protein ACJZ2D_014382 [Fusarium nematophilum]